VSRALTLPTDSAERKKYPLLSGALRYAPAAFMLMAKTSNDGNVKHNPGEELHHSRGKSADHGDCAIRHIVDVQDIVASIERQGEHEQFGVIAGQEEFDALAVELGQLQWRVSLYVQEMAEKYLGAPLAPGAKLPADPPPPSAEKRRRMKKRSQ
jgi:hypothetical protein